MARKSKKASAAANDIFTGCDDLLNDFSLPEEHEHTDRFVSIDYSRSSKSITSSPTATPGSSRSRSDDKTGGGGSRRRGGDANSNANANASSLVESELARSKKVWGRAIDRYVASVLEDHREDKDGDDEERGGGRGGGGEASSVKSGGSIKSLISAGRSRRSKKSARGKLQLQHPDNYLLSALQSDTTSVASSSHSIVDANGHIDDSSFAPINPFGTSARDVNKFGKDGSSNRRRSSGNGSRRLEQAKEYLREEWKPISLIVLVILATVIVSATMGGGGSKEGGEGGPGGTHGLGTAGGGGNDDIVGDISSILGDVFGDGGVDNATMAPSGTPTWSPSTPATPTDRPSTVYPTYAPTSNPVPDPTDAPVVVVEAVPAVPEQAAVEATGTPSAGPTASPTHAPTNSPSPGLTPWPSYPPSTLAPTSDPTHQQTSAPSPNPTSSPTSIPTPAPTTQPTPSPTTPPNMPQEYYEMKRAATYVSGSSEPFETTSSPQSLAFHWLYYEGNPSTNLYEFFEQYALAVVFFSLTQARTAAAYMAGEGNKYDKWTQRREVCGWEGVRCAFNYTSEMVHVTEIHLQSKGLRGSIPDEIAFLPYISRLDLSDNEITGTVPEGIYAMKRLKHLFLNNNTLTGTISSSIDNLNLAEQIYLGQNSLTGTLPSNIGTNRPNEWRFFSVHDNQLSGTIHEGMKLKSLYMLDLSRNDFYGTIPSDMMMENYSTLRLLYLDHNSLVGTIPASLMQMRKMKVMNLNDNKLSGSIPYIIDDDQKVNMLTLRVQHNQLTQPVASPICALDVNRGEYELVELGVDCSICPVGCSLCRNRCY